MSIKERGFGWAARNERKHPGRQLHPREALDALQRIEDVRRRSINRQVNRSARLAQEHSNTP